MYHFVKFNNTWYLKPEKLEDVIDYFKKFCGREFEEGFEDFCKNSEIRTSYDGSKYRYGKNHSSSVWRYAVEMAMDLKGMGWLESAVSLEEMTYKDRIKKFLEGKPIFFTDGLSMTKKFGKMNLNSLMNISMRTVDSYSGLVEDIGM